MLPDFERKMLRILVNYVTTHGRMAGIGDLKRMTGRDEEGIKKTLEALDEERYIRWNRSMPVIAVVILEEWERGTMVNAQQPSDALKWWPD